MNPNPEPANSGAAFPEWPSEEAFEKWLQADPANFERWSAHIERAANGEFGPLTPELRAATELAVAQRKAVRSIKVVLEKFAALAEVMQRPPGTMLAEDRLAQCQSIMDELADAMLETPEPHRSTFLKQLLPLREQIRAIKLED